MNINNISVDNLRSENPTETLIIDVREPNEYNAEHIIGAINIPLSKIDIKLVNLANLNKNKIVLYCQSGKRSLEAYKKIINTDNLSNLEGGINLWKEKSFPTNFMKKLLPIERQIQIAMGSFLLIGIILSIIANPYWLLLSFIISLGLLNAGITGWCGLGIFIAKMPWNKV
ncbi:MAG TPA: DUF2892 domain-containing protein [Alphaproteobacteria bacterium]|jgi:rhodanese-related sulfurtransferase|nr:DUF2892 domain-containing protein [Alphaproteobacteria bacterium]